MKRSRLGKSDGKGEGSSSSSERDRENSEDGESNNQAALAALEAHFAQNFDLPVMKMEQGKSVKGKGKRKQVEIDRALAEEQSLLNSVNMPQPKAMSTKTRPSTISSTPAKPVQTIIFGERDRGAISSGSVETSNGWRKFMSSKVATKTDEEKKADNPISKKASKTKRVETEDGEDVDDDQDEKNAQTNDRALSDLLSTTLFAPGGAGSTAKRSNGRPILGSNDTLARLLELSQPSMSGKVESQGRGYGAALLKSNEMGKMPVEIRHGMRRAEMENQEKQLQRQKELGNYHHSIKGLVTKREGLDLVLGTKSKDRAKRTRDKGLSMGVGKFSGGMLKLSEQDIQRINKPSSGHSHKRRK